jgi:hypothetical protein
VLLGSLLLLGTSGLVSSAAASPAVAAQQPAAHVAAPPAASTAIPLLAQTGAVPALINYNSNFAGKDLCLGIAGGLKDTYAVQWSCNRHTDQQWAWGNPFAPNNTAWRQLVNADGQCLGTNGGLTKEGTRVVGWSCYPGHTDQYWWEDTGTSCGEGAFHPFYNLAAVEAGHNYVLGVGGDSYNVGAEVVIWNYQNVCNNQFWALGSY